jgi:hypothetical protein
METYNRQLYETRRMFLPPFLIHQKQGNVLQGKVACVQQTSMRCNPWYLRIKTIEPRGLWEIIIECEKNIYTLSVINLLFPHNGS